jgi:hypothetical protein
MFSSPTDSTESVASVYELEPVMVGRFGRVMGSKATIIFFPLWYPALVFALAGVAALRFRRQFSIRSALVAVSVVAALLGMVVAL